MVFLSGTVLVVASCSHSLTAILNPSNLHGGWPPTTLFWQPKTALPADWREGKQLWSPKSLPMQRTELPFPVEALFVGLDAECVLCHETYVTAFADNVHRRDGCESCHGPASWHITSRGEGIASILSLNKAETTTPSGRMTTPGERAEVCLRCHEKDPQAFGPTWRTSVHAHQLMTCTDCHHAHYNVPPGTPSTVIGAHDPAPRDPHVRNVGFQQEEDSLRGTSRALGAITPDGCYECHGNLRRFEEAGHPHRIGARREVPANSTNARWPDDSGTFDCTTCHDPHGNVRHETRKELCLQCHDGPHMNQWHGSQHDLANIGCTDCHDPHPATGVSMSVDQPNVCYRCHSDTRQLQEIAGPHQILGPNGFNCSTCHVPHGRVTAETRSNQCLQCHTGSPTMAWHSSYHFREGVACADCHEAHPNVERARVANVSHTNVVRPNVRPMGVADPETCYKCHPKMFALASLPSHHPIREGKLRCSDCHDSHGQEHGSLKAPTLNQLCFECHAEKEGPFVWEHAPVTENCGICHEPHGSVTNNLLHQPTMFLCLRCHTGHSTHGRSLQCTRCHLVDDVPTLVGGGPRNPMIPTTPASRQALFTDCTQCHSQVHGSDSGTGFECGHGMRR